MNLNNTPVNHGLTRNWLNATLATLAAVVIPAFSQSPQIAVTKGLTVTVLQGDSVQNELPRPATHRLAIRVLDGQGAPISKALAAFELPEEGASATFVDGSNIKVLLTDPTGEASTEIKPNDIPGKFQPKITVNYLGQTSSLTLNEENLFPAGTATSMRNHVLRGRGSRGLSRKTWLFIAGGAAVAIVAIIATHHGHSSAAQQPSNGGITITPGNGTVQGGH